MIRYYRIARDGWDSLESLKLAQAMICDQVL